MPREDQSNSSCKHQEGCGPSQYIHPTPVDLVSHYLLIVGNQHNDNEQRGRQKPIYHCGPKEGADRIDAEEIDKHSDQGGHCITP